MHVLVRAVPLAIVSMAVVCNRRGYAYDGDALLWSTHCGYTMYFVSAWVRMPSVH